MDSNAIVAAVADALDQAGIPFMLAGSFSSNFYGVSRATRDADFVIQLDSQSIPDFARTLAIAEQRPRLAAVAATYRTFHRIPDSTLARQTFKLIDQALAAPPEPKSYTSDTVIAKAHQQLTERSTTFVTRLDAIHSASDWRAMLLSLESAN